MLPFFKRLPHFPGEMFQLHWDLDDYDGAGMVVVSFDMFRIFNH